MASSVSTTNSTKRQYALLLLALFSSRNHVGDAFAPPQSSSRTTTAAITTTVSTRRYVGKWPTPFSSSAPEQDQEDKLKTALPSKVSSQEEDVEGSRLVSAFTSFFPKDTAQNTKESMGDLVQDLEEEDGKTVAAAAAAEGNNVGPILGVAAVTLAAAAAATGTLPAADVVASAQSFFADPSAALEHVTEIVADMGPLGPLYFGVMYTIAEVLAIPAVPLTASAGYLFGVTTGTAVVLVSASIAASISFVIGRTLLRTTVENMMVNYPQFAKMDKAIGKEGFKLMLLLRLSPLFPFALSNYLYGATSIDFASFFWGTLFGFAPGTLAYVYTGVVGKALTIGGDGAQPWYVYAGGAVLLSGLVKVLVDVAGNIVAEIEEEAEMEA